MRVWCRERSKKSPPGTGAGGETGRASPLRGERGKGAKHTQQQRGVGAMTCHGAGASTSAVFMGPTPALAMENHGGTREGGRSGRKLCSGFLQRTPGGRQWGSHDGWQEGNLGGVAVAQVMLSPCPAQPAPVQSCPTYVSPAGRPLRLPSWSRKKLHRAAFWSGPSRTRRW